MKLLLVEDEEDLSAILAKGLRKRGYAVDVAYDGEEALACYEINEYDLLILDLNLPKVDGIDVLQQIRTRDAAVKILILSARSAIEDRVLGLDLGANDYLIKPFDFMELEARIRTLLRISFIQRPTVLSCGALRLNTLSKTVSAAETAFHFTKKEYAILEYLFLHQGSVVSAEELIEHVWDSESNLFSNSLKYHIHTMKKKLGEVAGCAELVQNIREQGYVLKEKSAQLSSQNEV